MQLRSPLPVIVVTAYPLLQPYPESENYMAVPGFQLNSFERVLFRVALVLAGLLVIVRVGAVIVLSLLHHHR